MRVLSYLTYAVVWRGLQWYMSILEVSLAVAWVICIPPRNAGSSEAFDETATDVRLRYTSPSAPHGHRLAPWYIRSRRRQTSYWVLTTPFFWHLPNRLSLSFVDICRKVISTLVHYGY